jgi:hypothetical protein
MVELLFAVAVKVGMFSPRYRAAIPLHETKYHHTGTRQTWPSVPLAGSVAA